MKIVADFSTERLYRRYIAQSKRR